MSILTMDMRYLLYNGNSYTCGRLNHIYKSYCTAGDMILERIIAVTYVEGVKPLHDKDAMER